MTTTTATMPGSGRQSTMVNVTSNTLSGRSTSKTNIFARPTASNGKRPSTVAHVPTVYDIYGHQVPFGKGSGLARPPGNIKTLNGEMRHPADWTRTPRCQSKSHLLRHREAQRKIETDKDLHRTDVALKKVLYDRKHISSYSKVMQGSCPIPVKSPTRSALLSRRHNDHLSSMNQTKAAYEAKLASDPMRNALKEGMKTHKKKWSKGKPSEEEFDGPIAKGIFHPPHLNDPGLKWIDTPKFKTREQLRQARLLQEKETGVQRMDESVAITENQLRQNYAKDLERRKQLGSRVPSVESKKALLARRSRELKEKVAALRNLKLSEEDAQRKSVLNASQNIDGWFKTGNEDSYVQSANRPECTLVMSRKRSKSNSLINSDPFKSQTTSVHKLLKEKNARDGGEILKPNEIDRFTEGHKAHVRSRSKPPPKALKRWADVVIEFKEAEKKRDAKELAMINGDEYIGDSEEYYNPLDDAPMFSSFSKTLQFVEPVYGLVKQELEEEWPSIMLKPLNKTPNGRKLTCMEKIQRMRRFRRVQAEIRADENKAREARIEMSMKRSSSLGSGIGQGLGRVSRPQSALDASTNQMGASGASLQVLSRTSTPGPSGPKEARSMGTLERKMRRPQSVPAMGVRKVGSAVELQVKSSSDLSVRPGTAPLPRSRVRTSGGFL
eukprot:Stramenopile-MAST_4_protein_14